MFGCHTNRHRHGGAEVPCCEGRFRGAPVRELAAQSGGALPTLEGSTLPVLADGIDDITVGTYINQLDARLIERIATDEELARAGIATPTDILTSVLKYHVVRGAFGVRELAAQSGGALSTLEGSTLPVLADGIDNITVGTSLQSEAFEQIVGRKADLMGRDIPNLKTEIIQKERDRIQGPFYLIQDSPAAPQVRKSVRSLVGQGVLQGYDSADRPQNGQDDQAVLPVRPAGCSQQPPHGPSHRPVLLHPFGKTQLKYSLSVGTTTTTNSNNRPIAILPPPKTKRAAIPPPPSPFGGKNSVGVGVSVQTNVSRVVRGGSRGPIRVIRIQRSVPSMMPR
ncbi:unnamed protein product [Vitrella brassicaformis CCMP3155]|uniref:Uncharacterized protein n=1 Tax=Vitrella brassicaformis (strain CCMP3155) TaxID=1169540 RepID=A0A0G4FP84_VITBC|nr:unnamed protein product [Vitrella brassicaformis CCMP3155]|eukprot:CEM16078.1 unnamed protein product [Vitrella brassicaformis CCMP3155]